MGIADVIGNHCGFDDLADRHLVCPSFYFAAAKGDIVPNRDDGGWELPHDPPRHMNWRAKYYAEERGQGYIDHSGDPYLWTEICPWCGGELPTVVIVPRPLLPRDKP